VAHEDNPSLDVHDIPAFFRHLLERFDSRTDLHFQTCTTIVTPDYIGTALYAYSSVLAALYDRERTGRGAVIPIAMLDVTAEMMGPPLNQVLHGGEEPPPDRLRFGDRVLCPFLRPFFLTEADEARVRHVAETLWRLGERVARVAIDRPSMLADLALSDDEVRLARIDPGYETTSTAGRSA